MSSKLLHLAWFHCRDVSVQSGIVLHTAYEVEDNIWVCVQYTSGVQVRGCNLQSHRTLTLSTPATEKQVFEEQTRRRQISLYRPPSGPPAPPVKLSLPSTTFNLPGVHEYVVDGIGHSRYSFRSLASKGFPSGYSKSGCVGLCVCPHALRNLRTYWVVFANDAGRIPPRRYRLAVGELRSSTTPKPMTVLRWIKLHTRCAICMLIAQHNTGLRESRRGVNRPW